MRRTQEVHLDQQDAHALQIRALERRVQDLEEALEAKRRTPALDPPRPYAVHQSSYPVGACNRTLPVSAPPPRVCALSMPMPMPGPVPGPVPGPRTRTRTLHPVPGIPHPAPRILCPVPHASWPVP
ncbi:hypothetical protein DENSPDRAFT_879044 [Dentipellis sp. KUC8613]|nr:hypothetical protein DENSPDRAFT_879044 [Dentipellis sp. KUC8613]